MMTLPFVLCAALLKPQFPISSCAYDLEVNGIASKKAYQLCLKDVVQCRKKYPQLMKRNN